MRGKKGYNWGPVGGHPGVCEGDIETSSLMASLPVLAPPLLATTSSPTGFPHLPLFCSTVRGGIWSKTR